MIVSLELPSFLPDNRRHHRLQESMQTRAGGGGGGGALVFLSRLIKDESFPNTLFGEFTRWSKNRASRAQR